jgi:hypothetical protein
VKWIRVICRKGTCQSSSRLVTSMVSIVVGSTYLGRNPVIIAICQCTHTILYGKSHGTTIVE